MSEHDLTENFINRDRCPKGLNREVRFHAGAVPPL